MRDPEPLQDWEQQLHRDLDALPELQAPATLIPAVLRRIEAQTAPRWYRAPWWQWPPALRLASFLVVLGVVGGLGWVSGWFSGLGLGGQLIQACAELKETIVYTLKVCESVLGAGGSFWRPYGQTLLIGAATLLLMTYLTCLAAGTALYQLAWRRSA